MFWRPVFLAEHCSRGDGLLVGTLVMSVVAPSSDQETQTHRPTLLINSTGTNEVVADGFDDDKQQKQVASLAGGAIKVAKCLRRTNV